MKSYGIEKKKLFESLPNSDIENLKRRGYTILKSVLEEEECREFTRRIGDVYGEQEKKFGRENLYKINELDVARMPFLQDDRLIAMIDHPRPLELVKAFFGDIFQLHLQNAIINRADTYHHQGSWHRDLPYQHWIISKPLAVNVFYCLTDFTAENGATILLPYSQHFEDFPSDSYAEENSFQLDAKAGDVLCFNSMVFHRAGVNVSRDDRIGVNHVFTSPIIKPQIEVPRNWKNGKYENVIGSRFNPPSSVDDYRKGRY